MLELYTKYFHSSDKNCYRLTDFFQLVPENLYKNYDLFEFNSLSVFLRWAKKIIDSNPQYYCYSQHIFYDCLKYQEYYNIYCENPAKFIKRYRQEMYKRCFPKQSR